MPRSDDAADIAYIRSLAEEGRQAPPMNGPILVAAALIFGAASLGQWAIVTGLVAVDPMAQLWIWLAAGAAFATALFILIGRAKSKPGYNALRNEAIGAAWSGVGFLIFTVWLSMMARGVATGDWTPMHLMPSLVLAAYGTAWLVAAAMGGFKWMNAVALLSYAGAVAVGALSDSPHIYLAFVGVMVLVALLPGLALVRAEKAGR